MAIYFESRDFVQDRFLILDRHPLVKVSFLHVEFLLQPV